MSSATATDDFKSSISKKCPVPQRGAKRSEKWLPEMTTRQPEPKRAADKGRKKRPLGPVGPVALVAQLDRASAF
jgi:hypothetical protein